MNLDIENIKNLIDEIYIKKNNDIELQKKLLKKLSKYIGNTYYNLNIPIFFNYKSKNKDILGRYSTDGRIIYFMGNLQKHFNDIKYLFEVIFVVSHEFGHAHNHEKRNKVMYYLNRYEDLNNLLLAKNIADDFEEPDYTFYMNFKEYYLDFCFDSNRSYYQNNITCCNEENLASLLAIHVAEDMFILMYPDIYSNLESQIKSDFYKYNKELNNFNRYDSVTNRKNNVDVMFDKTDALKQAIHDNNKLIRREYKFNYKRKKTSQLLLETYKIISVLRSNKLEFKKFDILEKRKKFYVDLMIKRDMTFPERLDDLENLINYHNIFYNIEWLKNLIISWIYQDKINTKSGYSEEEVEILRKIIIDYLNNYESKNRKK